MQLDVDVDPEPLTDWFSSTFLQNRSPVNINAVSGHGHGIPRSSRSEDGHFPKIHPREATYEGEEVHDESSVEEVVSNLQTMDVRYYLYLPSRSLTARIAT